MPDLQPTSFAAHAPVRLRVLAMLTAAALGAGPAHGQDGPKDGDKDLAQAKAAPSTDPVLLKKLEQMEQRIRTLEGQLKQRDARATDGTPAGAKDAADPKSKDQPDPKQTNKKGDQKT